MTLNTVIFVWWTCLYIGNHLHFCTSQRKYIFSWHDKEPGHNPSNYWGSSFHFCHLGSKEGDSGWAALNIHLCCYCKERWTFELCVTYYNIYKAYKPYTHIFFSSFDFLNMRSGIVKLKIFSKLVNLKKKCCNSFNMWEKKLSNKIRAYTETIHQKWRDLEHNIVAVGQNAPKYYRVVVVSTSLNCKKLYAKKYNRIQEKNWKIFLIYFTLKCINSEIVKKMQALSLYS